jgi:predicted anti-sigma-YlaC factor YlaD
MSHSGDLLSALLDGELTAEERAAVTAHLRECGDCRAEAEGLASVRSAVRSLPALELPPGLLGAPAARRRPRRAPFAWAAAAVVAGVVGVAALTGGDARPIDLGSVADQHTARVVVDPAIVMVRAPMGAP